MMPTDVNWYELQKSGAGSEWSFNQGGIAEAPEA